MTDSTNTTRFFMQQDRVHTSVSGNAAVVCFRAQSGVLAETRLEQASTRSALLAADSGDSVVRVKSQAQSESVAYNAYGVHSPNDIPPQRPAFNGHLLVSDLYLLGNGYRGYNPVLMRFQSPDNLSPFAEGGLNCYVYCAGDPINFSDPSGHMIRSRSRSPIRMMSPTTQERIVLDALNSQPGWRAAGGNGRSMSPTTQERIVQEALSTQPGWNTLGTPAQNGRQSGQTPSSAQTLQMLGGGAGQAMQSSASEVTRRRKVDAWAKRRKAITSEEARILLEKNTVNERKISTYSVEESRRLRTVAIAAMAEGGNVQEALMNSRDHIELGVAEAIAVSLRGLVNGIRRVR